MCIRDSVCIGNPAYHICEFAEMQERNGNTYVPSAPKISDEICTYESLSLIHIWYWFD